MGAVTQAKPMDYNTNRIIVTNTFIRDTVTDRSLHHKTEVTIGSVVSRLSTFSKLELFQPISVHREMNV